MSDGTWNYTYDKSGNLTKQINPTTGDETDYHYDIRNRPLEVAVNPGTAPYKTINYTCNMDNRLIGRSITTTPLGGSLTTTTASFAYDGANTTLAFMFFPNWLNHSCLQRNRPRSF